MMINTTYFMSVKKKQEVTEGSHVLLNIEGREKEFYLERFITADMQHNHISIHSPVGKTIVGKYIGYKGSCTLPDSRKLSIEILKIL